MIFKKSRLTDFVYWFHNPCPQFPHKACFIARIWDRNVVFFKMAANSHDEDFLEITSPLAPTSFNVEGVEIIADNEVVEEMVIDEEEEEKQPFLELKQLKEWLLQQKISHESELLARKLINLYEFTLWAQRTRV